VSWVLAWHEHLVLDEPVGQRAPETTNSVDHALRFRTHRQAELWAMGLWGDDAFANKAKLFVISVEQLAALRDWRSRHGLHWRMWLKKEWDRGDCRFELRQLRNTFGPEWLHRQRLVR
jgi:hypothetical protein